MEIEVYYNAWEYKTLVVDLLSLDEYTVNKINEPINSKWGIFTRRVSLDTWEFRYLINPKTIHVHYFDDYIPLLNSICYLIEFCFGWCKIRDGIRVWRSASPVLESKWAAFDVEFHLTQLVPFVDVNIYCDKIRNGEFTDIVRNIGGVDPLLLRRYTENTDVIQEAIVLSHFTKLMKRYRRAWLGDSHCASFTLKQADNDAWKRLSLAGVFVLNGKMEMTLKWASDQIGYNTVAITHCAGVDPVPLGNAPLGKSNVGDVTAAVDHWIDRQIVVNTMLHTTDVPLYESGAKSVVSILEAKEYVCRNRRNGLPLVTISELGELDFNAKRVYACTCKGTAVEMQGQHSIDLEKYSRISRLPFTRLFELAGHECQVVAAFQLPSELAWIPWLKKLKNPENHIYIKLF